MFYLNCFLIYSILGYLFETATAFVMKSGFKSGILYGPWTPVYGIGAIITLIISEYFFKNLHLKIWQETIIVFIIITLVLTFIEWLGGIGTEFLFKKSFWDYSKDPTSIGKYISIRMSIIWGIGAIIFIYFLNPMLKNFIGKIPNVFTYTLLVLFVIDYIITFINRIKL